jgi:hypothetical protein
LVVEAFLRRDVGVIGYGCLHQQCEAAEAHATGAAGAAGWGQPFRLLQHICARQAARKATKIRALALQNYAKIKNL